MTTCRICFNHELYGYCPQCNLYSCETCYKLHQKECGNLIEFKYHLCKQHGYQLDEYCCECCQMTCGMCNSNHLDHSIISIKIAADNIARDLKEVSRELHDKEVQLNISTGNIRRMQYDIENKIENEERKWLSSLSNIKHRLLSEIEDDLKHDSQLQLPEILNEAKVNLDSLKKGCFSLTLVSKWTYVKSAMHLFEKVLKQRIEGIAQFEKRMTSDFSQIFRSHMVNFSGTSVDYPCIKEIDNLTTMFADVSMGETSNLTKGKSKTHDEIIDGGLPAADSVCRNNDEEIPQLKEQLRHLQKENEQMKRMQIEEKSYIEKVCADMVKLTNKIPEKTKFGGLTIPSTETATINTLRQTLEITLNRLVEINNNQIITEQQLKEKILYIAKWTDEQRNASQQDRNILLNALKEQESKISQYEKELQKRSDRLNELQASNRILTQYNYDLNKEIEHLGHENGTLRARVKNVQDTEALRHSMQSFKLQLMEKERYILTLEKEKDDLHTRLSSVAGDRLTKGNPEITDLGDPNRPMKISEKYGELYDNEWTDAMECTDDIKILFKDLQIADIEEIVVHHLYKLLKDQNCVEVVKFCRTTLLKIRKIPNGNVRGLKTSSLHLQEEQIWTKLVRIKKNCCYVECLLLSQEQLHIIRTTIKNTLLMENQDDPALSSILSCKDISIFRRKSGDKYALVLLNDQVFANKIIESLTTSWDYIHKNEKLMRQLTMTSFFQKCVQLCWLMAIQDPVLYLSDDIIPDTVFDKNIYREYVKSGDKVQYAVWPALFLHENGPVLFKGVVQAYS